MAPLLRFLLFGSVAISAVLAVVGILFAISALLERSAVNDSSATHSAIFACAFGVLSIAVAATTYLAVSIFP